MENEINKIPMNELPEWLQKLWSISPELARKAEIDYLGLKRELPVYASTFDDKGELNHIRLSSQDAGDIITKLSKKVNCFETFIDSFNEDYR